MSSFGKAILVVLSVLCLSGCTLHFKATDLEIDAERQRVDQNHTYELEKVVFLEPVPKE